MDKKKTDSQYVKAHYDEMISNIGLDYENKRWHENSLRERDYKQTLEAIKFLLEQINISSFAEIGCGPGTWTEILLAKAKQATLIDISKEMLSVSSKRFAKEKESINYVCADLNDYDLKNFESVDMVFSSRALEYIDKDKFAAKTYAMLRNKGSLICITKNPESIYRLVDRICLCLGQKKNIDLQMHSSQISATRLRQKLIESGYNTVEIYPVVFDVYLPLSRFKLVQNIQLGLSKFLHKLWVEKQYNCLMAPWVESYIVIARKDG